MISIISEEQEELLFQGIWKTFKGSELRIARWNNVNFLGVFNRTLSELNGEDRKNLTFEKEFIILSKAMAGTILTDWKNVRDQNGNEISFSKEMAERLLRTDIITHNFVRSTSQNIAEYEI